ncbi:uncharacterized protein LOC143355016 [Halictus rubicundus]|uniref:uncharacterized protein LOC143355016 n=1 Tax=Halictus rubicundus TaxID=77578 RepID=UPI004034FC53
MASKQPPSDESSMEWTTVKYTKLGSADSNLKRKSEELLPPIPVGKVGKNHEIKTDIASAKKRRDPPAINTYPSTHKGPAFVSASFDKNEVKQRNSQNALLLAKALNKINQGVEEIKPEGFGKFSIKFKSAMEANQFVKAEKPELKGVNTFIPKYRTTRRGIIKGFSTDCEIDDILKFTDSPVPIIDARRLNRRVRDSQNEKWTWVPRYNAIRKDRLLGKGGGIAIFIAKGLKYKVLNSIEHKDAKTEFCCVQLLNTQVKIVIAACYRPPHGRLSTSHWDTFVQDIEDIGPYLIMGDLNAHHTEWNCSKEDGPGRNLLQVIDDHNIDILNHNLSSHYDPRNNSSNNLDLILAPRSLSDSLYITQEEDPLGSDHYPLFITFSTARHYYTKETNKLSSIRTDWNKYSNLMDQYTESLPCLGETTGLVNYTRFTDCMRESIYESTPRRKLVNSYRQRNPVPWWDPDCDREVRLRKALFKKWKHQSSSVNWQNYKRQVAATKKLLQKKKRDNFRNFAATLSHRTSISHLWKHIKILKNKWTLTRSTEDIGSDTINLHKQLAVDKISPPWVPVNPTINLTVSSNPFLDSPFNFVEFNAAIERANPKSSPGPDGLDYQMLKHLSTKSRLYLLDIFNDIFQNKRLPEE